MHDFEDDGDGISCVHCGLPARNARHYATTTPSPARTLARTVAIANGAPRTSVEAAFRALENSHAVKAQVFAVVAEAGARGITDEELTRALPNTNVNTLRPRRIDLTTEGLLEPARTRDGAEVTRLTSSGSLAVAWTLTAAAVSLLMDGAA